MMHTALPAINSILDQVATLGKILEFLISVVGTALPLSINAVGSSNEGAMPPQSISVVMVSAPTQTGGAGSYRVIVNASSGIGSSIITLQVTDRLGMSTNKTFNLVVNRK